MMWGDSTLDTVQHIGDEVIRLVQNKLTELNARPNIISKNE